MSQRTKKARLDRSDEEDYSDQDVHSSYGDELGFSSPRQERGDTGELK